MSGRNFAVIRKVNLCESGQPFNFQGKTKLWRRIFAHEVMYLVLINNSKHANGVNEFYVLFKLTLQFFFLISVEVIAAKQNR